MSVTTLSDLHAQLRDDPRAVLTSSEITHLRKLHAAGCASKARGGWVCRGTFYKEATFRRFIALDLAFETYFNGHKVQVNMRGRAVIERLAERRSRKAG